jgi:phospholipase C
MAEDPQFADSNFSASPTDPIKHVVLLLLENHSFDQMLGCFKGARPDLADLEGIDPTNALVNSNRDDAGNIFLQKETYERQMIHDPKHEHPNVVNQLKDHNKGFVRDFVTEYPTSSMEERAEIMGYYRRGFLPALHALAENFTICDHWFSSLPGPTWPNRFFALSGTCSGHIEMPSGMLHPDLGNAAFDQTQASIFDRLNVAKKSWKVYYYDIPCSLILTHQRRAENLSRYCKIEEFFDKDAQGTEADFPEFVFIEPKYFGVDQNDDHPPHNVIKSEKLIADVYNALRSNPELWPRTLLVVLFDEHGGFYDHVVPPSSVAPDDCIDKKFGFKFDQLGVRVPAILASPYVGKRVEKTVFDHTSLLKYLVDKWNLGKDSLGTRVANANSIQCALLQTPRLDSDMIQFIRVSNSSLIPGNPDAEREDLSCNHKALDIFAAKLEEEMGEIVVAEFVARAQAQQRRQGPSIQAKAFAMLKRSFFTGTAALGKVLVICGEWLRQGLENDNATRAKAISDAVEHFKQVKLVK